MNKKQDILVEAFLKKYGMINLLRDVNVKKLKNTSKTQVIMCCPFHDDNTESFSVNIESGLFTCFACDAHGDLFEFVKLAYNVDYKEAREFIKARSGLSSNVNIEDITFIRDIYNITVEDETEEVIWPKISSEMIDRMYSGKDPYNYLLGRGFSQKTIEYFECGYAEDYLGRGYANQQRITIPGHDEYGNICGFIGRTPIEAIPKYLYTANYPKSYTLFNLHRAKKHSKQGLIIVEGSLDVMRVHDLQYPNVCAILGSKLSVHQQQLLIKYTDKVYFMFDNDDAGFKANKNAILAMKDDIDVYFVSLTEVNDPGDLRTKNDLDKLIGNAKSLFEYELMKGIK